MTDVTDLAERLIGDIDALDAERNLAVYERDARLVAHEYVALSARLAQAEQERGDNDAKVLARVAERGDLHVLGLPVDDLRSIYQLVSDWNRKGGRPDHIEDLREREQLRARLREYEELLKYLRRHLVAGSPFDRAVLVKDVDAVLASGASGERSDSASASGGREA